MTSKSKNAFVHLTGQLFRFPSRKLVVVGLDPSPLAVTRPDGTDVPAGTIAVKGSHDLWRADCRDPAPQYLIESARAHGILQPGKARKLDEEYAEVVMGRDRTKTVRVLNDEGNLWGTQAEILMPMMVWPKNATISEMIGAANTENSARKKESLLAQAEGAYAQYMAHMNEGATESDALKSVSVSTGSSVQRVKNLLEWRSNSALVKAYTSGTVGGEALLAIATLPADKQETELAKEISHPSTIVEIRERVSYAKAAAKASAPAKEPKAPSKAAQGGKSKPAKAPKARKPKKQLGMSKALMAKIAENEMALAPADRNLDLLVLKAFKVAAGVAEPSTLPGCTAALKAVGLEA